MNWKKLSFLFFVLYLITGLLIYRHYGINWDEGAQHHIGLMNWDYIFNKDKELLSSPDRYHGPVMEVFQIAIEKAMRISDEGNRDRTRHLVNFMVFYASVIAFFFSARILFKTEKWALAATLMLVLSPKIFGESFYNSKDTICLGFLIFWLFSLLKLVQKPGFLNLLFHALTTALAVDIRILTVIIIPLSLAALANDYYLQPKDKKKLLLIMPAYVVLTAALVIFFWPTLWHQPAQQFLAAINQMKRYPWEGMVFYMGKDIYALRLPWHYALIWILISTPTLFTVLWAAGTFTMLRNLIKNPFLFISANLLQLIIWLACVLPVIIVSAAHAVLLDSWRHLYFIYPFFVLGAVYGLKGLWQYAQEKMNPFITCFFTAYLAMLAAIIIYMHPVESTYFNLVALAVFHPIENKFERDYWGLSYKQALEYLLHADIPKPVKIKPANGPGEWNKLMFTQSQQQQFAFRDSIADADYYMTNYRWDWSRPKGKIVYEINKFGVPVMTVLKIDK